MIIVVTGLMKEHTSILFSFAVLCHKRFFKTRGPVQADGKSRPCKAGRMRSDHGKGGDPEKGNYKWAPFKAQRKWLLSPHLSCPFIISISMASCFLIRKK
jgi:hypothetical protein